MQYKQRQIASPLVFLMISSVDHVSPGLGLTVSVILSKNGSSFHAAAGAVTEIGNGWYKVAPNLNDFVTIGPLILHATALTADPTDAEHVVVSGYVDLSPVQNCDINGNVKGAVSTVLNPVRCLNKATC